MPKPFQHEVVIAIPAKNEEDRLGPCLAALASQVCTIPLHVVVLLNNCTDTSEEVVRNFPVSPNFAVTALTRTLDPTTAGAGVARSLAMDYSADLLAPDGVLMTTDADSRVPPNWVAANLTALQRADAVAGRAVIDPVEAAMIPQKLHDDDARECAFALLLDEIASLIDPDPCDPWPRHDEHSGASIAVHVAIYRRAGGMPRIALGEDRAFFTALRRIDARVRHAPEVWVTVSGRTVGRAAGGMADTMRRRLVAPDPMLDARVEDADRAVRRAYLRRMGRQVYVGACDPGHLARQLQLPVSVILETLRAESSFGAGWERIEATCSSLARQPVPTLELAAQTSRATEIRDGLKRGGIDRPGIDLADSSDHSSVASWSPA